MPLNLAVNLALFTKISLPVHNEMQNTIHIDTNPKYGVLYNQREPFGPVSTPDL